MITITAPEGIGEVGPHTDLAAAIMTAAESVGGLRDGDVLVVTSKIISKHEQMEAPASERQEQIDAQTVRTVARRRSMAIVETGHGLTQAAAGIDNSNVRAGTILLLPADPDASARRLRAELQQLTGARIGVIISDTAGRAWRLGQTDHAIGAAGLTVLDSYLGRTDAYGNELHVTMIAIADELAGAADLAKRKLGGRPVALIRGAEEFLETDPQPGTESSGRDLLRPGSEDLFRMGVREAVIHAVLTALDVPERYEQVVRLEEPAEVKAAVLDGLQIDPAVRELVDRMLDQLD